MNLREFSIIGLPVLGFACGLSVQAATVDLADKPLASGTSGEVKPNVMLILDDSGSMGWTHLPDHVRNQASRYGYKSAQCNGMYYNPAVTYPPPLKADGTPYSDVDFYNAPYDGYDSGSSKVNLSTSFRAYDDTTSWGNGNDTAQAAYYYRYSGSQPALSYAYESDGDVDTSTTFYMECNSSVGSTPGKNVFTKVAVGASERQNFANWYSYYRIRLYTAKTAVGRAVASISEPQNYRLGFTTHSYTGTSSTSSEFQKIDGFCVASPGCAQRTSFYDKLYGASASGGTPLRAALSKVGRIYAGKLLTGADDPVQYSCQQNFAILTTDGFWNGDAGYQMDGTTAIGNQDGAAAKPMWDGATSQKVETYRRYNYYLSNCLLGRKRVKSQEQRQTVTTPLSPPGDPVTGAWTDYGSATNYTTCQSPAPALPDPNPTAPELVSSNTISSGGTSNSLADVAMYYYQTDLRTGNCLGYLGFDLCENNVPGSGDDTAAHQHMTTFTLGLGIDGSIKYAENYDSGGSADFNAIKQGTKVWPDPMDTEDLHRVDDLWHAAVNGRGKYFSAKSPELLASGLVKALAGVSARTASAAAAATSNLEPVAGDNYAYVAKYTTVDWDGDIEAREIDLENGVVKDDVIWSAREKLDALVAPGSDSRKIKFVKSGALAEFNDTNLSGSLANFDPGASNPNGSLSQYATFTAAQKTEATPQSVIAYLRGQTQHEDQDGNAYRLYRDRKHVLGDIVHGAPVYVKKPPFNYSDSGYASFAKSNESRQGIVYAAANDGMLHAFNSDTGTEEWTFVPSAVMPYLYKLADKTYSTNHRFYVDGPITVGDVCFAASCSASQWQTILVGGLGKGGRAFYALDVTIPTSPKLLWEFADDNLGYSYGNALITKRASDGKWVVIFASGYNNVSPGDGTGRLFVLDAETGAKLGSGIQASGSVTDPAASGIAKISNWVDSVMLDNSTQHVYGGDLDGNVWRFDIVANTSLKVTTIGKVNGAPTQSITTRPELGKIPGSNDRAILIGAGKYLGTGDIGSTDMMSIYAIRDNLTSPPYGYFRTHSDVATLNLTGGADSRSIAYTAMGAGSIGWYMDLDVRNGERVDVDPKLQLGWLAVAGNIPDPNVCNIGGSSWLYFINYWPTQTGNSRAGEIVNVGNSITVGLNTIRLPNGKVVTIATTSDAKYKDFGNPPQLSAGKMRRLYWRELTR